MTNSFCHLRESPARIHPKEFFLLHEDITDLRTQWQREQSRWLSTADTQAFQATYQQLLQAI